jgi:hypothetical protein
MMVWSFPFDFTRAFQYSLLMCFQRQAIDQAFHSRRLLDDFDIKLIKQNETGKKVWPNRARCVHFKASAVLPISR